MGFDDDDIAEIYSIEKRGPISNMSVAAMCFGVASPSVGFYIVLHPNNRATYEPYCDKEDAAAVFLRTADPTNESRLAEIDRITSLGAAYRLRRQQLADQRVRIRKASRP